MRAPRDARKERLEPREVLHQRGVGEVGPLVGRSGRPALALALRALQRAHELAARDEVAALVVPGQRVGAERAYALEQRSRCGAGRNLGQRLVLEHELAETHRAARDDGFRARVPRDLLALDELRPEVLEQVRTLERRGEQDPRVALAVVDLDRDDEFLARDRLGTRERRAATVRELVAAVVA